MHAWFFQQSPHSLRVGPEPQRVFTALVPELSFDRATPFADRQQFSSAEAAYLWVGDYADPPPALEKVMGSR
jgi:hypothetical protein